jgi:phage terminase Nu1 subunit (DNA packaging protein)
MRHSGNFVTPFTCTTAELVQLTGYNRRTIQRMVHEEAMPCQCTGKQGSPVTFNPSEVVPWLIEREKRRQHPKTGALSLEAGRIRLIRAQADREELENEKRRGEVIYFSTALDVMTSLVSLVTSRLEGVAGRLANELVNEPNPAVIRDKLLQEHRAIRQSLADGAQDFAERSQREAAGILDAKTTAQ